LKVSLLRNNVRKVYDESPDIRLHQLRNSLCPSKSLESLKQDLHALSGDVDRLEAYLKGDKDAQQWYFSELEDMMLKKYRNDSEEVKLLVRIKGKDIVAMRKQYLENN
jgi:hypothetical protein